MSLSGRQEKEPADPLDGQDPMWMSGRNPRDTRDTCCGPSSSEPGWGAHADTVAVNQRCPQRERLAAGGQQGGGLPLQPVSTL